MTSDVDDGVLDSKGKSVESDPTSAEDSETGSATTELDGGLATGVKLGTAETNTLEDTGDTGEKLSPTEGTVAEAVGMADVVKGGESSEMGMTVENGLGESEGSDEAVGVAEEKKEALSFKEGTPVGVGEMMDDAPLFTSALDEGKVDTEVIAMSLLGELLNCKVGLAVTVTVVCAIVMVTVLAVASTGRTEALGERVADAAESTVEDVEATNAEVGTGNPSTEPATLCNVGITRMGVEDWISGVAGISVSVISA